MGASSFTRLSLATGILFCLQGTLFAQGLAETISPTYLPVIVTEELMKNSSHIGSERGFLILPDEVYTDEDWDNKERHAVVLSDDAEKSGASSLLKVRHLLDRQNGNVLPCGSNRLTRGTYYLQSPNYPRNYPNRYSCTYFIFPPNRGSMTLTCNRNRFSLEQSRYCINDFLRVQGSRYCGTQAPPVSRDLFYTQINFVTNSAGTSSGFRCLLEAKDAGNGRGGLNCGYYRVQPGTFTIRSHNYPANYGSYRYCRWFFYGYSSSDQFSISCSRFNLQTSSGCQNDFLAVSGTRFCGTSGPRVTRSARMQVDFSTDASGAGSGFSCTVRVTANGCRCGIRPRRTRIVGGQPANDAQYPWMAGIVSSGGTRTFCGGSLINNLYVLTAAHCTAGRSTRNTQVLLGDHRIGVSDGESRHGLSRIIQHPRYTNFRNGFDFSLLRLAAPVTFTIRRQPVCMPTVGRDYARITATATGFGRLGAGRPQATVLQVLFTRIVTNADCRRTFTWINNSHLCAGGTPQGGRATCNGDSGGPLVVFENGRFILVGVTSFARPCAFPNTPDGYGRVTTVLDWIQASTRDAIVCTP